MTNVVLTGFMGTGKTVVGQEVARRLGCPFVDMDAEIEARAGKSISRIFAEDGEAAFRRMEAALCRELSNGPLGASEGPEVSSLVIATGGGALVEPANRALMMRRGAVICQTCDADGSRGFVLTLSTREQHIRREKASSNICTNQGLVALAAAVYMAALGKCGMRQVAELCYHRAHYAQQRIVEIDGFTAIDDRPFFKEFAVRCPRPVGEINDYLLDAWGIVGGYDLGRDYPDLADHMLLCVTEMNPRDEIDALVEALKEVVS